MFSNRVNNSCKQLQPFQTLNSILFGKGVLQKLTHRGKQNTVLTTGCFLKIIHASDEANKEHLLS